MASSDGNPRETGDQNASMEEITAASAASGEDDDLEVILVSASSASPPSVSSDDSVVSRAVSSKFSSCASSSSGFVNSRISPICGYHVRNGRITNVGKSGANAPSKSKVSFVVPCPSPILILYLFR